MGLQLQKVFAGGETDRSDQLKVGFEFFKNNCDVARLKSRHDSTTKIQTCFVLLVTNNSGKSLALLDFKHCWNTK